MTNWSDNDALWRAYLRFGELERRRDTAPAEAEQVATLLGLSPPARILDLCCGVGRHSIELARRGFRVVGVDRFEPFLELARSAAAGDGVQVEWVRDDMRSFRRPGAFDAAVSLFTSFGYFHDDEQQCAVLRNVFDSLQPGGRFLVDVMGKEVLARVFRTGSIQRRQVDGGEAVMLDEAQVGEDWHHVASTWTFLWPDGARERFELKCRCYSATELKRLLHEAGFAEVKAFGGVDGSPCDHQARRLVVTGTRP